MLFVNNEHHDNFSAIERLIPKVAKDLEYRSTAYLLALPLLYSQYGGSLKNFLYPPYWMYQHMQNLDNSDMAEDVYQIGLLSIHLWNGDEGLNLLTLLNKVNKELFAACMYAINIRKGSPLLIFV